MNDGGLKNKTYVITATFLSFFKL